MSEIAEKSVVQLSWATEFPTISRGARDADVVALALLKAPSLVDSGLLRRPPLRISAAIDVSGSMRGKKLDLTKESLLFLVQELTDVDEFGIIGFESTVFEALPKTKMNELGKRFACAKISELRDRCSTNLAGGLFAAINQVHRMDLSEHIEESPGQPPPLPEAKGHDTTEAVQQQMDAKRPTAAEEEEENEIGYHGIEMSCAIVPDDICGDECDEAENAECVQPLMQLPRAPTTDEPLLSKIPIPARSEEDGNATFAVLLFTDGLANEGVVNSTRIVEILEARLAAHRDDFVINTFGFGSDHNAELLRRIAECSQGSYSYIEDVTFMKEAFANCLGGLVSVVTSNLHLAVRPCFASNVRISKVWTKYPVEDEREGSGKKIFIKDMFSEEQRDVLLTLHVDDVDALCGLSPQPSESGTNKSLSLATLTLSSTSALHDSQQMEASECISIAIADGEEASRVVPPNPAIDEQRNRLLALEAMEAARVEAEEGNLEDARLKLESVKRSIVFSTSASTALNQCLAQQLLEAQWSMSSPEDWRAHGSKKMAKVHNLHARQRCNDVGEDVMYQNVSSKEMRAKARKSE